MGTKQNLINNLVVVTGLLEKGDIPYALAGGLAFSALVEPRATMDIDILIMIQDSAINSLIKNFKEKFESVIPHEKFMEFNQIKIWRVICRSIDHESIIDFIIADSEYLENVIIRATSTDFSTTRIKIISLEDLILLKSLSGRDQDKADLNKISIYLRDQINYDYLRLWSKKLNIKVYINTNSPII